MREGVDGAQHAARGELGVGGDSGEERVRRRVFWSIYELSELHGEYEVVQGEIEISKCAEAEAGGLDEEESGVE